MHCSPLIGLPHSLMDDMRSSIPAFPTRRGPGSKTRCHAAGGFTGPRRYREVPNPLVSQ